MIKNTTNKEVVHDEENTTRITIKDNGNQMRLIFLPRSTLSFLPLLAGVCVA